jgi:hypothetical protein
MQAVDLGTPIMEPPHKRETYRIDPWRVLAYQAVCFLFLVMLAFTWLRPNSHHEQIPDWKPVLALAEVAREKNELYEANGLYAQAGKLAARSEDWAGLLGAACGMKKLEQARGPYSTTKALLFRALMAAETKKSVTGMIAVANAFTALGEHVMAAQILSRVKTDWEDDNNDSAGVVSSDCWAASEEKLQVTGQ